MKILFLCQLMSPVLQHLDGYEQRALNFGIESVVASNVRSFQDVTVQ